MKYFATGATIVSLIPSIVGLTIDSLTNVVQCQPSQITWRDGTPPYFLSILPGGQPSAPPLKSFPQTSATALTWLVDIAGPTPITLAIKDSTGTQAYSSIININTSSDSSCINPNVTISGSAGTAAPTTAGNTAPPSSGTTTSKGTSSSSSGSSTGSTTKSNSPASTSKSAASQTGVAALGLAGIMGLVGAALF